MAKEFRVEVRHDVAIATRDLLVFQKSVDDVGYEVLAVVLRSILAAHRIVGNLFGQGDAPVGHPQVSEAVPPVLPVKFQVGAVSGISVIGAPDLDAGPRVPRESRHLSPTGRGYGVWFVRRKARSLAGGVESSFPQPVFVRTDRSSSGDEVGVDEEVPEALSGQELLEPGSEPCSGRADRTRPSVSWAVGAFREPDSARPPAESTAVARDADPQLGLDRLIPTQEGQISVGRGGHDDFDSIALLQTLERGEQVSIVLLKEVHLGGVIELGRGLVEPRFPVGPATMTEDPW